MFPVLTLPIPPDLLVPLLARLEQSGEQRDLGELAVDLLRAWLVSSADTPAGRRGACADHAHADHAGGYLWKEVFLPNGTQLRGAGEHPAIVSDGQLLYRGRPTSPNRFCGGSNYASHNAWKAIVIKRPGDTGWTRAWRLRREAQGKPPPQPPPRDFPPLATPLREPFPQPEKKCSPLCDPLPGARAGAVAASRPESAVPPRRHPSRADHCCVPLEGDDVPGSPDPHAVPPPDPAFVIARERRWRHARRVTDAVWDE